MHELLWEKLLARDVNTVACASGCPYMPAQDCFIVPLLNHEYHVLRATQEIQRAESDGATSMAPFLEQLCILSYLINAQDLPLARKLVKAEQLEAGQFFFRGPHGLPTDKLVDAFGTDPAALRRAGERMRAKTGSFGDVSLELRALPRVPLTFVLWGADEEFEARASILFDETVTKHMPLDALQSAVALATKTLINNKAQ